MTYARLHVLTLVVFFYHDVSYISFIRFVLDIDFFSVIFYFSYHVVIAYIVIMHEHLSIYTHTHTHTLIRLLLMTLNSHVQDFEHLLILFRCLCDRTLREELGFLSLLVMVFLSLLSSCYFRF